MKGRRDALRAAAVAATVPLWPAAVGSRPRSRRVGVALGSGGLHGLVHVGAIRAFRSLGFRPHAIAGCSVGAIAGALWAAGVSTDDIEAVALDTSWREADRWRVPRLGLADPGRLRRDIDVAYRPYEEPVTGITGVAFQMFHITWPALRRIGP